MGEEERTVTTVLLDSCLALNGGVKEQVDVRRKLSLLALAGGIAAFGRTHSVRTCRGMRAIRRHLRIATPLLPTDTGAHRHGGRRELAWQKDTRQPQQPRQTGLTVIAHVMLLSNRVITAQGLPC
jgi:hypothetical protein